MKGQGGCLLFVAVGVLHILPTSSKLTSHLGEGASQARWATCDLKTLIKVPGPRLELNLAETLVARLAGL